MRAAGFVAVFSSLVNRLYGTGRRAKDGKSMTGKQLDEQFKEWHLKCRNTPTAKRWSRLTTRVVEHQGWLMLVAARLYTYFIPNWRSAF